MIGKQRVWWLVGCLLLISTATISWGFVGVTPRLSEILQTEPKDQFVKVDAVLSDQLQAADLLKLVIDKPRRLWRGITVPLMIEHSSTTQARLRRDLTALEKTGDVRNIQIIWIGNLITFEGKVGILQGFFERYPELRSLDIDPDIPIERVMDSESPAQIPTTEPPHTYTTDWGLDDMQCHQMWAHGYWGQGIILATIDTGVDSTHPALQPKIWHNLGEIPGNGIDDDGNGYIDDTWGWNFDTPPTGNNNPNPGQAHGTNTAGIMVGSNGNDTVGVAPRAKLMVLRDNSGGPSGFWLSQQYAVRNGADVISSSLSWKYPDIPDYASFRQITDMELVAGVIHANSIGNQGTDLTNYPIPYNIATPGNCPPPWLGPNQTLRGGLSSVMGVGAYQNVTGRLIASYSGRGPAAWDSMPASRPTIPAQYRDYPYRGGAMQALLKPDIALPTDSRTTNTPGGGYTTGFNGTSAATPHLGGALTLLLSALPDASPMELCEALKLTADTSSTNLQYNLYGSGRARVYNALLYLQTIVTSGFVRGTVIDTTTNQAINHATVTIYTSMARDTVSDSSGHFTFLRVRTGVCSLMVSAPGYLNHLIRNIQVDSAETTSVAIYMRGPRLTISPDTISVTLHQGDSTQAVVHLSNTGIDTLRWGLSVSRLGIGDSVYQTMVSVPVSAFTHDSRINGIEDAWGKIWLSGDNNFTNPNYFYRFNHDGSFVDSIRQPHLALDFGIRDLAFDGQYLWGSDSQYLYGFDSTGTVRDSVLTNLSPSRAIALDPVTHYFYIGDQISPIQVVTRTGQLVRQWTHPLHIFGLAWYAADPDSMPLYIFSADSTTSCLLSKMNPVSGVRRPLRLLSTGANQTASGLGFSDSWSYENRALLSVVRSVSGDSAIVKVINMGFLARWLSYQHSFGTLTSGARDSVALQISAVNAPVGNWSVLLKMQNNSVMPNAGTVINFHVIPAISVVAKPTSGVPASYAVSELYPNPFNPSTSISISLPSASPVNITMFDRLGRESASIQRDRLTAGSYRFEINGKDFASGVYFIRVQTKFGATVKKGVLLK